MYLYIVHTVFDVSVYTMTFDLINSERTLIETLGHEIKMFNMFLIKNKYNIILFRFLYFARRYYNSMKMLSLIL